MHEKGTEREKNGKIYLKNHMSHGKGANEQMLKAA